MVEGEGGSWGGLGEGGSLSVGLRGYVAALVRPQMNGLNPFQRTIETNNRNNAPSPKTITAAAMTTNRITSL